MAWNRHAHPNESSVGCVFCVPEVIFAEVSAVKSTRCPLCLPKLHADVVHLTASFSRCVILTESNGPKLYWTPSPPRTHSDHPQMAARDVVELAVDDFFWLGLYSLQ